MELKEQLDIKDSACQEEGVVESTDKNSTIEELAFTDIRTCWDEVRPGIEEILKDRTLNYRPEDVYAACVAEQAFLYKASYGFVILTVEVDEFTKERTLFVWLGYTYEKGNNIWVQTRAWFDKIARSIGCTYVGAHTKIKELETYFVKEGWELDTRIFRRKV